MDSYCILPWIHEHIDTQGFYKPCCISTLKIGKVESGKDQEKLLHLKQQLLAGEQPRSCNGCWLREQKGLESERLKQNAQYAGLLAGCPQLKTVQFSLPISFDLRISNRCNLRCRTCWIGASSSWFSDARALGQKPKAALVEWNTDSLEYFKQLPLPSQQQACGSIPEFYFAGGEPFLEPRHGEVLEILLAKTKGKARLRYTTNLTRFTTPLEELSALFAQFESVTLEVSIDHLGSGAEWMRKGKKWSLIEANLRCFQQQTEVQLIWHPTVSLLNVRWLPYIHKHLVQNHFFALNNLWINVLERPSHFSLQQLPPAVKETAIRNFVYHISWLEQRNADSTTLQQFQRLLAVIKASEPVLPPQLKTELGALDTIRKEKSADFLSLEN